MVGTYLPERGALRLELGDGVIIHGPTHGPAKDGVILNYRPVEERPTEIEIKNENGIYIIRYNVNGRKTDVLKLNFRALELAGERPESLVKLLEQSGPGQKYVPNIRQLFYFAGLI